MMGKPETRRGRLGRCLGHCLGLCLGLAAGLAHGATTTFSLTDLGDLPGGRDFSLPLDLNDRGQVVGYSATAGGEHGFLWQSGTLIDLGELAGGADRSIATGLNNRGQVVGYSSGAAGMRAILWQNGQMQALDPLGGHVDSLAAGINDAGLIVGTSVSGDGQSRRAVSWSVHGWVQDLGLPVDASAGGVNNQNVVMGTVRTAGEFGSGGFLYNPDNRELTLLPDGDTLSALADSAVDGQIGDAVGVHQLRVHSGHFATYRRADGSARSLGLPDDYFRYGVYSTAEGLNAQGDAVGSLVTTDSVLEWRAVWWTAEGESLDLTTLIDPDDPWSGRVLLSVAYDINAQRQIVATGRVNGVEHAFLLTPVPEPGTAAAMLAGLAAIGMALRRWRPAWPAAIPGTPAALAVSGGLAADRPDGRAPSAIRPR